MLKKMRQCRLNFADNRYDCEAGIIGEHYATELIVTPPAIMPAEAVYRLCFEPGGLSEIILQTTDGAFSYPLPSAVTATPYCCVTLIGYVGSEQIYKSRMVRLHFSQTADGDSSIDLQQPGIVDEVNRNTAARHGHDNKAVLDKFAESDGEPTYDGQVIGGGGSTGSELFIVNVQAQSGADEYTITSHNKTYEQIDAAYKAGKQVLIAFTVTNENNTFLIPLGIATETDYEFLVFANAVFYVYVDNTDTWDCYVEPLEADSIKAKISADSSAQSLSLQTILNSLVYPAVEKAHEHNNEDVLDKLSVSDGKLQYNGSDVSLKPAYYIDLAGTYPNYTCPVSMDDIKAAYNSGYSLVCRCKMGAYTATLPLFIPMTAANTWIFSGSGALKSMGMDFPAQSFTVAITANGVVAEDVRLARADGTLPNPYELQITVGNTAYLYDGSERVNIVIDDGTEVSY